MVKQMLIRKLKFLKSVINYMMNTWKRLIRKVKILLKILNYFKSNAENISIKLLN